MVHELALGPEKLKAMMQRALRRRAARDQRRRGALAPSHGEGATVRRRDKRVRTIALAAAGTLAVVAGDVRRAARREAGVAGRAGGAPRRRRRRRWRRRSRCACG